MEKSVSDISLILKKLKDLEAENKALKLKIIELESLTHNALHDIKDGLEPGIRRLLEDQENVMYMAIHDLKNPLSNIKAINGIFLKDFDKPKEKQLADTSKFTFLKIMEAVCEQTFSIVKDVLLIGELKIK